MRAALLATLSTIAAGLVWLIGTPLLGQSNPSQGASAGMGQAGASSQPRTMATIPRQSAVRLPGRLVRSTPPSPHEKVTTQERTRSAARRTTAQHGAGSTQAEPVTIDIPRIGVQVAVVDRGVDASGNLPIANGLVVTHYIFSGGVGALGNYVAYGHDDIQGSVFEHLDALRVGDPIELVSGDRRYLYRVTASKIVAPTDVQVLKSTPTATMTLITCTPYMVDTQRIVVNAALDGVEGV
jgi:LPXTG-site transpeptidase (sortase) family protein